MKQWTEAAEMRWESYLRERVARENLTIEESAELRDDLRRHIHEELNLNDSVIIGLNELEQALAKMDEGYRIPTSPPAGRQTTMSHRIGQSFIWFFAVIFPFMVVLFEWLSHFCGLNFFNPIPTFGHGLLLLSVPVINGWLMRTRSKAGPKNWRNRAIGSGLSFGTSIFYALLFIPLLPASCIAMIAFGMGLLSMCPVIAWIMSWKIARAERAQALEFGYRNYQRTWWLAACLTFSLLVAYEIPALWTRHHTERFLTEDHDFSADALRTLRKWHSRDTLLNMCYENAATMEGGDISSWIAHRSWATMRFGNRFTTVEKINKTRDLYFRVTGEPFNAMRRPEWTKPSTMGLTRRSMILDEELDLDHGGDQVAAKVRYLDCKESRFDAHLDTQSSIGYGEWTLVFHNGADVAREARCQIRMPRHGHVTRLTLWINGEPNEAAFGNVAQVKAAYREVAVVQRRDPVLVNMVGPDTIMVQCFPVPSRGDMKIRIGITAPLDGASWNLPRIIEKNFGETSSLEHTIWIQSDKTFQFANGDKTSLPDDQMHSLHLSSKSMNHQITWKDLPPIAGPVWCVDPFTTDAEKILIGEQESAKLAAADPLIVVVDGSKSLHDHRTWIADTLRSRASRIFLAQDESIPVSADELKQKKFHGGCDNEEALYQALLKAKESPNAAVVWLHGPQPVAFTRSERIQQILERGSNRIRLFGVAVVHGNNRLFESLGRTGNMSSAPDISSDRNRLGAWLDTLKNGENITTWKWSRRTKDEPVSGTKVSDQLARLWAMEEVAKSKDSALAVRYQLVSYVSGAVVLENKEQYERHGLKQVDATSAPAITNIPETSTSLLVLISTVAICLRRRR